MPFVYRYKDIFDDRYKYIGIVKGDTHAKLKRRIEQHRREEWFKRSEYYVDYMETKTICDAEAIEGSLIGKYETYKFYNKAKRNWGESSLFTISDDVWNEYGIESKQQLYRKTISALEKQVSDLIKVKAQVEKEVMEKRILEHTFIKDDLHTISFSAIESNLLEKIKLYDGWSLDCATKTSADKWAYRSNRLRSAIFILRDQILEMLVYSYSKEYQEDSKTRKIIEKGA